MVTTAPCRRLYLAVITADVVVLLDRICFAIHLTDTQSGTWNSTGGSLPMFYKSPGGVEVVHSVTYPKCYPPVGKGMTPVCLMTKGISHAMMYATAWSMLPATQSLARTISWSRLFRTTKKGCAKDRANTVGACLPSAPENACSQTWSFIFSLKHHQTNSYHWDTITIGVNATPCPTQCIRARTLPWN